MSTTIIELENKDIVVKMSGRGPIGPRGLQGEPGPAGPSEWGVIQGNISDQTDLQNALDAKANVGVSYTKAEDDALLAQKADADSVYTKTETDALLSDKADTDDVYSKTEINTLLSGKADSDTVYTKTETDTLLDAKADVGDSYTKAEEDALLAVKANSADVYTKTETDTLLADKADADDVYTKDEVDDALADKADSADVYTKTETDALLLDKAPVILSNASGSIASFTDGSASPVTALTVSIDPVQDLHGYDNPWPAGGGKNLVNPDTLINGYYNLSGVFVSNASYRTTPLIPVSPSTVYSGSFFDKSKTRIGELVFTFWDANENFISQASVASSVTTTAETAYVRIRTLQAQITYVENNNFLLYAEQGSSSNTFSPYSNICPISGHTSATVTRTGKNLFNPNAVESGYFYTDGSIRTSSVWVHEYIRINGGDTYTISGCNENSGTYHCWFDKNKTFISRFSAHANGTYTAPNNAMFMGINAIVMSNNDHDIDTLQLELGSSASAYEPYQGTSVTIDLNGTRYGGTLNVLAGEMTVTKAMITKNTANMNNLQNYPGWKGSGVKAIIGSGKNTPLTIMSNVGTSVNVNTETSNDIIFLSKAVYGKTQDEWIALAMDVQMVFDYATPLTVQLSPSQMSTLLGQNNVWADTGDVAVEYRADTRMYIDQSLQSQSNALKLMLTPNVETEMVASQNYALGSIVIVNNVFLKLTSAVASGANLVIGSNCVKTTMAEWVASLTA